MHHSEILLQLDRNFAPQYIRPAQMKEIYESDNDGVEVSLEEVTHQFRYLVKHNILTATDNGFRSDDRFELSDYWDTLSNKEKDGWYSTVTSSQPVDIKYRRINTILAALRHFQTYQNDDLGLQECFFYDCDRLSDLEIDDLCQSINFGDSIY